ncbi:MAG: CoA pyrophosphatase [Actinobacteria bacterium]|nr:CoA pyrophosphatase [Actinomycetota bacterium]
MYPAEELRSRLRDALRPAPHLRSEPGRRLAAVLIPVLAAGAEASVVFTRRTETLTRHPGEISFPGGLVDPGEDLPHAVLREAEEELGLLASDVELLGTLEPVHTHVSGILVVPFVGMLWEDPRFTPNPAEIAEVLKFPLRDLAEVGGERDFEYAGREFRTFVYDMEGSVIWGATGRILWAFIEMLRDSGVPVREGA